MKTTKEMIEVMEAYEDGAKIQKGIRERYYAYDWRDEKYPEWNWGSYSYRIKLEECKFQVGDMVVMRDYSDRFVDKSNISEIQEISDDGIVTLKGILLVRTEEHSISFVNRRYVNFNDVLWYWEFKMSDGWHKSQTRMTKAEAVAFVGEDVEIAPLYGLGFRLPQ
ncbi:hypothetical protein [Campylobacter californiensis]|uniref:hypothetical protein n=1 Tax=Campylobacter californiensis TaxID=1032243 RepID=UPI0014765330|nr:hypothetical protein [Campylobacter sp. RM12916]MBE3610534.1 hypothetical protein [Campylobacter sp. RM12916]